MTHRPSQKAQYLRWGVLKAATLALLLSPVTTFADPVIVPITPADLQAVFRLVNRTNPGRPVEDYHMKIEHDGPGNLNFKKGFHGTPPNQTPIVAGDIMGNGTQMLQINLNFTAAVTAGNSRHLSLEFNQRKNAIRVTESFWTTKDIQGNSVPVPAGEGGNVTVPGFTVVNDPQFTIINDFDTPMGIRGLQFLLDVPGMQLEDLDPGNMPGFSSPLADFVLAAHSALLFNLPGDLAPGLFLYAQGRIFDDGFNVETGAFIFGHQQPVPEPTTLLLFGTGLAGVAAKVRKRRRAIKSKVM